MQAKALIPILIVATLAGCAEEGPESDPAEPINTTGELGQQVNATVQDGSFINAEEADAFILPAKTGPNTPLTSFHWRIPNGSFVPHEFFDDWKVMALEMVPTTKADITEWGVAVFQTDGAEAVLVGQYSAMPTHQISKLAVLPTESTFTPQFGGFFLTLYDFEIQEGDRLTFVVYGTSETEASLDFAFRVLDEDPSFDRQATDDPKDILRGDVVELLPYATGEGLDIALYLDINVLAVIGIEAWTDDVTITEGIPVDARPMAAVRDVTLSAGMDSDGFSQGVGIYFAGDAAGLWRADIDSHGTKYEGGSVILDTSAPFVGLVPSLVFGAPIYFYQADGEGPSSAEFHLQYARASAGVLGDILIFTQVDMGATLETLTGVPGSDYAFAFTGLAGDVPPMTVDVRGDDVIIGGPVTHVFADVLA